MTVLNEGKYAAEFLLSEGNGSISREEVTVAAAAGAMVAGTVLGKLTASGKYVAYNNAAADGSEVAVAIALYPVPDLAVDQKAVVIARHAEVQKDRLTGLDAAGETDLKGVGVIAR